MPITYDTLQDIIKRVLSDVKTALPDLDPTIYGTFANALAVSIANRSYDFIIALEQIEAQAFPQTAEGEFLERWAEYEALERIAPTEAEGTINVFGTVDTEIPLNTEFTNDENTYLSTASTTTTNNTVNISSIVRSGSTATATAAASHGLASNQTLTISGAGESEYNGDQTITVTSTTEFTYEVTGSPTTPATGTITGEWDGAQVSIISEDTGIDLNLGSGATLELSQAITGIETDAYAQVLGVVGGADTETDAELRSRVLQSRENPVTNFNAVAIEKEARTIAGVTRVEVYEVTPEIGDVTVLFVRDNDDNIIPDAAEVAEVKAVIDAIAPANTDSANIYVYAPTATTVNFDFSYIDPSSATMKSAIQDNLEAYFESLDIGEDVTSNAYTAAINNTVDLVTGDTLSPDFVLTAPTGDITVSGTSIAILGDVTF